MKSKEELFPILLKHGSKVLARASSIRYETPTTCTLVHVVLENPLDPPYPTHTLYLPNGAQETLDYFDLSPAFLENSKTPVLCFGLLTLHYLKLNLPSKAIR